MSEGNGRGITSRTMVPIGAAIVSFGLGWSACWQIHDRTTAPPREVRIGPDEARDFWELQTNGYKRIDEDHHKIQERVVRIEALLEQVLARLK